MLLVAGSDHEEVRRAPPSTGGDGAKMTCADFRGTVWVNARLRSAVDNKLRPARSAPNARSTVFAFTCHLGVVRPPGSVAVKKSE